MGEPDGRSSLAPTPRFSFPEGEETAEEREIPPPRVRGIDHDLAEGETDHTNVCPTGPPSRHGDRHVQKTLLEGVATHRQRIDQRAA
jgi:hypothetical protein